MASNSSFHNVSNIASFRHLGITIGILDIVIGTVGNLLTIVAVMRSKKLRRQTFNIFIVNLSIVDLLTALVMMPFSVTGYILMKWPFGVETCILQAFFYFFCGYTSIVCLLAITINRLFGTIFPERYRFVSLSSARLFAILCWFIVPAFFLPITIVSLQRHFNGDEDKVITRWRKDQLLCTFAYLDGFWKYYIRILRVLFQLFPILIMIISYSLIFYKVRKSNTKKKESAAEGYRKFQFGLPHRVNRTQSHQERRNHEVYLLHISIVVCVAFTCLFLPSFIISLVSESMSFDPRLQMAASNFTWCNSSVNPFIYVLMYKPMQKEYKKAFIDLHFWLKLKFCC